MHLGLGTRLAGQLFDLYIGIEKEKNTGQLGEAILI